MISPPRSACSACLDALPSELICEILARVGSVASLYSVLTEWPKANLVFPTSAEPVLLARTLEESLHGSLVSLISETTRVLLASAHCEPQGCSRWLLPSAKGRAVPRAQPIPQPSQPSTGTPTAVTSFLCILGNDGQAVRRLLGQIVRIVRIARAATTCLAYYSAQCRLIAPRHLTLPPRRFTSPALARDCRRAFLHFT